ncbi:MAG: dTMP kinase [Candidatus Omnitrophica bacterium]|nr:dTMP kinase [Candidatus Omnitrophota bacterium]
MAASIRKGLFITFEGSEGGGKSTQSMMLFNFLKRKGFKVLQLRDPGSTQTGESIRKMLLTPGREVSASSEFLLYLAARAQLVDEKILPALKEKTIVICDRFADATVCYQGHGLGIDIAMIDRMNRFVTRSIAPDITFFLDASVKKGLRRCRNVKGFSDRIERRSYDFHLRVRNGYLTLAKKHPRRIKRISIEDSGKEQTQDTIRGYVLDAIKRHQGPGKGR